MAVNILSSDSAATWFTNTAGDTYVVKEGVYLAVNGTAIFGTAAVTHRKFQIDGHLIGEGGGSGMWIGENVGSGGSSTIQISSAGSVSGEIYGIVAEGGDLSLVNDGNLTGRTAGLYITGDANSVLNSGTILSYDGVGINSQGFAASIVNYGSITGETDGVLLAGIYSKLVNDGNIISNDLNSGHAAVRMTGDQSSFVNTGIVTIFAGDAVLGHVGGQTVRNHGLINGDVDLAGEGDTFHNENGSVIGDIYLGAGDDVFVNANGSVKGVVNGGSGNDIYYVDDATVDLDETSNVGEDIVYSSVSYSLDHFFETLFLLGHADLDGIGNSGSNGLIGNAGNNKMFGRSGDDVFYFSEGSDLLNGGAGTDYVVYQGSTAGVTVNLVSGKGGGAATGQTFVSIENAAGSGFGDRLIGNAAANVLNGYAGNDMLTGGKGKDTFYFYSLYGKDTITDFQDNIDKIELAVNLLTVDSFDDLDGLISQKGKNVVIDFSDFDIGNMLIIRNADLSDFSGKDFIFG